MTALDSGLNGIVHRHARHVALRYEDPETFGAGHFVLYPIAHSLARFAIEEQYSGTDWSDADRLPTSWAWRAEVLHRHPDGGYRWTTAAEGQTPSDKVPALLARARAWTRRVAAADFRREPAERAARRHRPPHDLRP